MLRVIRSTVQGIDIDPNREEDFDDAVNLAITAGSQVRETYSLDEIGQKQTRIAVLPYTDPDGSRRWAVLDESPAEVDWQDTDNLDEALDYYKYLVHEYTNAAYPQYDSEGNIKPLWDSTDVDLGEPLKGAAAEIEDGDARTVAARLTAAQWAQEAFTATQRAYEEAVRCRQVAFARYVDASGRGGQTTLAKRVALTDATVKHLADQGRKLLAGIHVYEDNAGQVYLQRDGEGHFWYLGAVTADMHGRFADDAQGWLVGDWEPNEDDGQERYDGEPGEGLKRVGTWNAAEGVNVARNLNNDIEAGAGGQSYLGVDEDGNPAES